MTKYFLTECPNCGSIWGPGSEEFDWQECDCCGYPECDEDESDSDDDEFDPGDDWNIYKPITTQNNEK